MKLGLTETQLAIILQSPAERRSELWIAQHFFVQSVQACQSKFQALDSVEQISGRVETLCTVRSTEATK